MLDIGVCTSYIISVSLISISSEPYALLPYGGFNAVASVTAGRLSHYIKKLGACLIHERTCAPLSEMCVGTL